MAKKELVLVTGGDGYIGSAVVKRLSRRYRVVALDRPDPQGTRDRPDIVPIDLGDDESVDNALSTIRQYYGNRIASVIHLAAYYDISGEPNPLYDKITVQGTRRLIDGLQSFECEQFVLASTMLIHRPTYKRGARMDEDQPIAPAWAYPESKVKAEQVLRDDRGDIPVVFLRIAGVYDNLGHSLFLAHQIARIYEHRITARFYPGMLCTAQSFVQLDDLADAIARTVERRKKLPPELALLIGEEDALEYQDTQDIIGRALHGEDWTTLRIPKPLAEAGAWLEKEATGGKAFIKPWMVQESNAHYILDTSRARELLGWTAQASGPAVVVCNSGLWRSPWAGAPYVGLNSNHWLRCVLVADIGRRVHRAHCLGRVPRAVQPTDWFGHGSNLCRRRPPGFAGTVGARGDVGSTCRRGSLPVVGDRQ